MTQKSHTKQSKFPRLTLPVLNNLKSESPSFRQSLYIFASALLFLLPACNRRITTPPPPPGINYTAQIQKAQEAYLMADYRSALSAFELILGGEFDPRMKAEPAYWAGLCHLKFGDYPHAEERLQLASKDLTAGYMIGPALVGLGDSQRLQGRNGPAKENYSRAIEQFATFVEVEKVQARLASVGGQRSSIAGSPPSKSLPPIDPLPTTSALPRGSFSLQAGAFQDRAAAMQLVEQLKPLGHPPFLHLENHEGKLIYKVRVGIYKSKAEAQKVQEQLKERKFDSFVVE